MPPLVALLALLPPVASISLDLPIQRLDATVKTIAERSGQTLAVAPNLAGEMVLVRVQKAPAETLLAKLAESTHAAWVRDGERLRLERSPAQERDLADAASAHRIRLATEAIAKIDRESNAIPYRPEAEAKSFRNLITSMVQLSEQSGPAAAERYRTLQAEAHRTLPDDRTVRRLAAHLDLLPLVRGEDRRGITYSTQPFGIQRPFPPAALAILDRYRKDQLAFLNALSGWNRMVRRNKPEAVGRIIVHASHRREHAGDMWLRLKLYAYSDEGTQMAESMLDIVPEEVPPAHAVAYNPPRLSLQPLTVQLETAYGFNPETEKPKPEIERMLRDADQTPRFRFAWSETLPILAQTPNVVADVSDSLEHWFNLDKGQVDLASARQNLLDEHEILTTGEWTTIRPRFADPAGIRRYHRDVEAQIVRLVADGAPISIEEAVAIPERDRRYSHLAYNPLVRNAEMPPAMLPLDREEALSLLGTLAPNVRASLLRTGGVLAGSQFGADLRRWIFRELLGGDELQFAEAVAPAEPDDPIESDPSGTNGTSEDQFGAAEALVSFFMGSQVSSRPMSDYLSEQNLAQARLVVKVEVEPALIRVGAPEDGPATILRSGIAGALAMAVDSSEKEPVRFRPARARGVTLRLEIGNVAREYWVGDWLFDPKAKPLLPSELPAWVRE